MCTTTSPTWTRWSAHSSRPLPSSASGRKIDHPRRAIRDLLRPTTPNPQTERQRAQMSDLEDLYREIILAHCRSPRNRGELPAPPAHRIEGFNPLCGDEVVVFLQVDDGVVGDIRITGQGCSISQSSASLMSAAVKGKSVNEPRALIRTFKSMMSIHKSKLDGDSASDSESASLEEPDVF